MLSLVIAICFVAAHTIMIGLVVSEFSIAIAFYDKLKDLEIPYE